MGILTPTIHLIEAPLPILHVSLLQIGAGVALLALTYAVSKRIFDTVAGNR